MKNKWKRLAGQWKRFRDQAKKMWNELAGSKSPGSTNSKEVTMNIKWNHIAGQWTRFQEKAREQWGELTDSELIEVNGRFEVLAKKIQEKYGIDRTEAKQQIDRWTANLRV